MCVCVCLFSQDTSIHPAHFDSLVLFLWRSNARSSHAFQPVAVVGIMGVLATQSKDPDDSDGLRQAYMDLEMAHIEIASLKLEVVRLKEELDECSQGLVCCMVVASAILPPVMISIFCRHAAAR